MNIDKTNSLSSEMNGSASGRFQAVAPVEEDVERGGGRIKVEYPQASLLAP
ncbi:hypothetical protein HGO37_09405 [Rhizobium sp. CG4]|uniref:hypothetical protein n=1 Tax=Rhizobium/Agrobacterium group TaxID=227290 RepID=UPI00177BFAEA|nr:MULTISPECIES: hypothetical protein [Rhizobium/Agrobacterium group]MBD9386325.1 hypothetical protein [Agrobacterium sp. AGB01]MCM2455600.1 hypothetical protein [Rhizobium sp. CG4]MDO5894826.1 hypothetical protein [Agrobacterium sp. Azo12]